MSTPDPPSAALLRALTLAAAVLLFAALAWVMLDLPTPGIRLAELSRQHLGASGVSHPVTAVLLNFRAYDTLLEVGVLLLAAFGALALRLATGEGPAAAVASAGPVLVGLIHLLVPLMVVLAGYLLWAGSHRPGGAFQAAAVLTAAGLLLRLIGYWQPPLPPPVLARAGLLLGFAVFLAVAVAAALSGAALLTYPRAWAGELILLIEAALTLSIALVLLSLFGNEPGRRGQR